MKLEDRIRELLRFKHYSLRTEEAYVGWYRQFVRHHGLLHPEEMGTAEVEAFLTHLAVNRGVVAGTQNQALKIERDKFKGTGKLTLGKLTLIGSKGFVNEAFTNARERFGARRRDGPRRMRGRGKPAAGVFWSLRDLRLRV